MHIVFGLAETIFVVVVVVSGATGRGGVVGVVACGCFTVLGGFLLLGRMIYDHIQIIMPMCN